MTRLNKALLVVVVALSATLLKVTSSPVAEVEKRAARESHDLVIGASQYGEQLMYQENIEEKYQWTGQKLVITRNITVPNNQFITQVRALDQMTDGTGAEPSITGGGPGLNYVSLRLKSQRWRGIYFKIEVYAKRR